MLNAEKFKDEILETLDCDCEGFGVTEDNKITMCRADSFCCICSFLKDGFCSREAKDRWLLSEYKEPIKLSKLEYGILKHILNHTEYRYIVRSFNNVYVYTHEPINDFVGGIWCVGEGTYEKVSPLKDLFQFVKDGEYDPMLIKDILNNCEVVDYD